MRAGYAPDAQGDGHVRPFIDSTEVIAGLSVIEAPGLDAALGSSGARAE